MRGFGPKIRPSMFSVFMVKYVTNPGIKIAEKLNIKNDFIPNWSIRAFPIMLIKYRLKNKFKINEKESPS